MSTKNVAIIGGSGNLGSTILKALIESKAFNVVALQRESSSATFPEGVTVKKVDFADQAALTEALKGQDAVVSALSATAIKDQTKAVEAAIAAGVKQFIPSEFGCDTQLPQNVELMGSMFSEKSDVIKFLHSKESDSFSWTAVATGPFFDWAIGPPYFFGFNVPEKTATIFNGGNYKLSFTTLADIGLAVVGALKAPLSEVSNRFLYTHSVTATQNEILAAIQAAKGDAPDSWKLSELTTAAGTQQGRDLIAKGEWWPGTGLILCSLIWGGDEYGNDYRPKSSNAVVGLTERDVKEIVASTIGA